MLGTALEHIATEAASATNDVALALLLCKCEFRGGVGGWVWNGVCGRGGVEGIFMVREQRYICGGGMEVWVFLTRWRRCWRVQGGRGRGVDGVADDGFWANTESVCASGITQQNVELHFPYAQSKIPFLSFAFDSGQKEGRQAGGGTGLVC